MEHRQPSGNAFSLAGLLGLIAWIAVAAALARAVGYFVPALVIVVQLPTFAYLYAVRRWMDGRPTEGLGRRPLVDCCLAAGVVFTVALGLTLMAIVCQAHGVLNR